MRARNGRLPAKEWLDMLWVAHGFTKQSNALDRRDIAAADSMAEQWRAQR